eukprot:CAMPEP_0185806104 /NCGR_PEP_ID=MMETSP1322-20130828/4235_1 /TAXON_ID=265543 /ORGANISM="Minutocellus polymorphus, Strain RCC2270" /LENGTH=411 /DNA_ID=CAMNT_0028502177 /DNA_START=97 /DNA_END=1332 /DNA_ORIENTATION=+
MFFRLAICAVASAAVVAAADRHLETHTCEPNPCSSGSGSYLAHSDPSMYVQCGVEYNGERMCHEMPCGAGTVWNQEVLGCVHDCDGGCGNPCANVATDGIYYHSHCDDKNIHQFIQCDDFGGCFVQDCAPGTVWSQDFLTCVNDCSHILGGPNPCPDALARGLSAVRYEPDISKYVQCDANSGCYVQPCGEDMIWNDEAGYCIDDPSRVIVKADSGGFVKTCENGRVYDEGFHACIKPCRGLDTNPCTHEAVMNGHMFHPHPEKTRKYLECWPNGACNVVDCPEGTKYSQYREMCVDMDFDCGGEASFQSEDDDNHGSTGEDARRQLRSVSSRRRSLRSKSSSSGNKANAEETNRAWQKGCEEVRVDRANRSQPRKSKGSKGGASARSAGKGKGGSGKGGFGKGGSGSSSR